MAVASLGERESVSGKSGQDAERTDGGTRVAFSKRIQRKLTKKSFHKIYTISPTDGNRAILYTSRYIPPFISRWEDDKNDKPYEKFHCSGAKHNWYIKVFV